MKFRKVLYYQKNVKNLGKSIKLNSSANNQLSLPAIN